MPRTRRPYGIDKFTGNTMEWPAWSKLMKAVEAGEVSRIVCWRLDCLGRTAKRLTTLFADLLDRRVSLVSLRADHRVDQSAANTVTHWQCHGSAGGFEPMAPIVGKKTADFSVGQSRAANDLFRLGNVLPNTAQGRTPILSLAILSRVPPL
jgi:hypothetical protein